MTVTHRNKLAVCLALVSIVLAINHLASIECAPSTSNGITRNKNTSDQRGLIRSGGLLSNLFRRQTSSNNVASQNDDSSPTTTTTTSATTTAAQSSAATTTSSESSTGSSDDNSDPQTQVETDAQKFLDSLPGAQANQANSGPTSFRERMSESFGVLREGVTNQFKSLRENWTETVDELRDAWSNSNE